MTGGLDGECEYALGRNVGDGSALFGADLLLLLLLLTLLPVLLLLLLSRLFSWLASLSVYPLPSLPLTPPTCLLELAPALQSMLLPLLSLLSLSPSASLPRFPDDALSEPAAAVAEGLARMRSPAAAAVPAAGGLNPLCTRLPPLRREKSGNGNTPFPLSTPFPPALEPLPLPPLLLPPLLLPPLPLRVPATPKLEGLLPMASESGSCSASARGIRGPKSNP